MEGNEIIEDTCDSGLTNIARDQVIRQMENTDLLQSVPGCSRDSNNHNLEMSENDNIQVQPTPVQAMVQVTSEIDSAEVIKRRNDVLAKYQAQVDDAYEYYDDQHIDDRDNESCSDFSDANCSEDISDFEPNMPKSQEEETENYKNDVDKIERFLAQEEPGEEFLAKNRSNRAVRSSSRINKGRLSRPNTSETLTEKCLASNKKTLQCVLNMEEDLRMKLEKIRDQYDEVTQRINHCLTYKDNCNRGSLFTFLTRLGIPYFKDQQFFHCPGNDDFKEKAKTEYIKNHFVQDVGWTKKHYWKISEAIRRWEIEGLKNNSQKEIEALSRLLKATDDPEEVDHLTKKMRAVEQQSFDNLTLADVAGKREPKGKYDWLKISAQDLNGDKTADECMALWDHYINPNVNVDDWTAEEEVKLKDIAGHYKLQNWEAIAMELGTNRTAYLCVSRFRSELHDEDMNIRFTKEEDDILRHQIETTRFGTYICWSKLEFLMKGRNKNQLLSRWLKLQPSRQKGKFTDHEDLLILNGVRELGNNNFKEVARTYLPHRFPAHIRNRYLTLIHNCTSGMWEKEEDKLIVNLVSQWGKNWRKINEFFHNRTRPQLRQRYNSIKKHLLRQPNRDESNNDMTDVQVPTRKTMKHIVYQRAKNKKLIKRCAKMTKKELKLALMKKKLYRKNNKRSKNGLLDHKYNEYFNVGLVYPQKPGRVNRECPFEEGVQENTRVLRSLFTLFSVNVNIPNDDVIMEDDFLSLVMKNSLTYLRDHKCDNPVPKPPTKKVVTEKSTAPVAIAIHEVTVEEISTADIDLPSNSPNNINKVTFREDRLHENISQFPLSFTADEYVKKCSENAVIPVKKVVSKQPGVLAKQKQIIVKPSPKLLPQHNSTQLNSKVNNRKKSHYDKTRKSTPTTVTGNQPNAGDSFNPFWAIGSIFWDNNVCSVPTPSPPVKVVIAPIVSNEPRESCYTLPPSFTTLCGLRTLLLSRDRINNEDKKNNSTRYFMGGEEVIYGDMSPAGEEAESLWKSRLDMLFTWPGLMAAQSPKLDTKTLGMRNLKTFVDEDDEVPENAKSVRAGPYDPGRRRYKTYKEVRAKPPKFVRLDSLNEDAVDEEEVDDPDIVDMSQPSTSREDLCQTSTSYGAPSELQRKRRRSVSRDSLDDEDVDDPDEVYISEQPSSSQAHPSQGSSSAKDTAVSQSGRRSKMTPTKANIVESASTNQATAQPIPTQSTPPKNNKTNNKHKGPKMIHTSPSRRGKKSRKK